MKKTLLFALMIGSLLFTTGCSKETVPQGTKGKILDREGFHPEVYPPSYVNVGMHGQLILVETTTRTVNETITVRMADDMNLKVQVRFQLRMGEKPESLNAVFNDIKPKNGKLITLNEVYAVYGKMIVNKVAREVLSAYKIGGVQKNFAKISGMIYTQVQKDFLPTPLIISDTALGKLDYPEVIDAAIESAAKRNLEIKQAEADVQVRLTELKGKELVAAGEYRIAMQKAKRDRDSNRMIAAGITPALIELRKLENQALLIDAIKDNKNVMYMPHDFFSNSSTIIPLPKR